MNKRYRRSPHTVYEVKYHFVFCPKYRYGVLEGKLKKRLQEMISEVCDMMNIEIVKGRAMEEGLPYQTFVSSLLHKYLTGRLVEWNQSQNG